MDKLVLLDNALSNLKLAANQDCCHLQRHLEYVRQQARPFDDKYESSWLLNDWQSPLWKTSAGTKTRQNKAGEWVGTCNINWDILLPDGKSLIDDKYSALLETCKRASFLYREGLATGDLPALRSWTAFNRDIIALCCWLVIETPRYRPAEQSMKLLDQTGVSRLLNAIARGGWTEALSLAERCIQAFYAGTFGKACPPELLNHPEMLPTEVCENICAWLSSIQSYSTKREGNNVWISRSFVAELIHTEAKSLVSPRLLAVLRQFEPALKHPTLLISATQNTELPSHKTLLFDQALKSGSSKTLLIGSAGSLIILLQLYRHLPDGLPSPNQFNLVQARRSAMRLCSQPSHTAFIPINTGLQYLNEALRWIVYYGDALVDYYLLVMGKLAAKVASYQQKKAPWTSVIFKNISAVLSDTPLPETLTTSGFNFERLTPPNGTGSNYERLRNKPSLQEALNVWVGSVVIVIALLKPSRDVEICTLPRNCLLDDNGRYWLDSELAKRTKASSRAKTGGKPIPTITARAIKQLQRLSRGLVEIFGETDDYLSSRLFYLPNPKHWGHGRVMSESTLNYYLDCFCDYVGLPPDEHGRRWYLRIHEMRKWFLLLLFWSGRYDVLDAARWIAGHTAVQHLYAYIEREFPGAQLGELEAEWAIDRLAELESYPEIFDEQDIGLAELYQRVLNHFDVHAINLVEERQWKRYVKILFEEDFHLEPYSISNDSGNQKLCVAIRAEKRKGAMNE